MSRRIVLLVAMAALALGGLGGAAAPAAALAPPPTLDACLRSGSFDIAEPICQPYAPARGAQYGPIGSIEVLTAPRGRPIALAIPGGDAIGFGAQPGQVCGDLGCVRNGTSWRFGPFTWAGLSMTAGCGAEDVTCTVVSNPPFVGDAGERYQVVYGQVYTGSTPTATSRMWALYTPPTIYPVSLTPVDVSGTRLALGQDALAYAVRAGADPTAGECADTFWYTDELAKPVPAVPACVTFRRGGSISSLEGTFEGWLPVDSGSWTIVAQPAGDAGAPLLSRPSGYTRVTVAPVGDDITTTIVGQRRPELAIDVTPRGESLALGETQVVDVTVSAVGGEAGSLQGITFVDPDVLTQGSETPPLTIVGVEPAVPDGGFSLDPGASRTFAVTVQATALGTDGIGAAVTGQDDLGEPRAAAERGITLVVGPGELGGPNAPQPPTIDQAIAAEGTLTGSLTGSVEGTPGDEVAVSLVTAPIGPADTCLAELEGRDVVALGSITVTIGEDGVGRFAMDAALAGGHHVYGVTVAAAGVSSVGPCTAVSEATPTVTISDVEVTEGTAKKGSTPLVVTMELSGPPLAPASIRFATADGTAAAPADYIARDETVTFAPGQRIATVTIEVVPDAAPEADETIGLVLSDPSGIRIGAGSATATIVDDDGTPASADLDIRGTWVMDWDSAPKGTTQTLEITRFNAGTGAWKGRVVTVFPASLHVSGECIKGNVCTFPASGTFDGDRLTMTTTLNGETGTVTSRIVRRNGTLTGAFIGKSRSGGTAHGRMTLRDPAP